MIRELHHRETDGLTVTLFAEFRDSAISGENELVELSCRVVDTKESQDFTIREIPRDKALEVFYHPFASGHTLLTSGALESRKA
jgi:hypothetical protein